MTKTLLASCVCSLLFTHAALAGDGHDHGEAAPAAASSPAAPRLVMESPQFELVGTLESDGLHLYLDDHASNAPVTDATLELDIAGQKVKAVAEADGTYHAALSQPLAEGEYAVMATILTPQASDLLTGDLDVHSAEAMHDDHAEAVPVNRSWLAFLPWIVGIGVLTLAILLFTLRRDRHRRVKI
ncbi:MAG: hypothetical protein BWK73_46740 [Thiothrix lacustris]|uniref:Uncharacterized protein n=1 Tax=Thiothrix lacustris TaxID=525917 RepID=A0A1Y1QAJ1_9GAMM|nr:MAG: hypothetical protein BWK73_46740 [Thiothrix lacustris]